MFTSLKHVLRWPVLSDGIGCPPDPVLATDYRQAQQQDPFTVSGTNPGIDVSISEGAEIPRLLRVFSQLVHVMNPVLDCASLSRDGWTVSLSGPQWDARTCIVVSIRVHFLKLTSSNLSCSALVRHCCFGSDRKAVRPHLRDL